MVKPEENSPSPDTLIETNFRNIGAILNQELLNRFVNSTMQASKDDLTNSPTWEATYDIR